MSKKAGRGKEKDMDYKDEEEERRAELLKIVFSKILRGHTGKDSHLMQQKKGS